MFFLAVLVGIYGYGIFALGIVEVLYPWTIGLWTLIVGGFGIWYIEHKHVIPSLMRDLGRFRVKPGMTEKKITIFLLFLLAIVNLIGVLGPETSFDALWYHLMFPKLYLENHRIPFIPGGLLYYSAMPKLGELLFVPALAFGNEILVKAVQYLFGVLTTVVVYKIARRYVSMPFSLLASLIFYSNIVVAWESTVAYIDLIRTFYEILALWALLCWMEKRKKILLYLSAVMLGFAISTKLLAFGSLIIFSMILVYSFWRNTKINVMSMITSILVYWFICIGIVLPWFIFSYIHSGNPVYPFFTALYPLSASSNIFLIQTFLSDFVKLFLFADDPISPLYILVLPLVFVYFTKLKPSEKILAYYVLFSLFFWYITPRTGGGRFILPYLPIWSILVILILAQVKTQKIVYTSIVVSIFFVALLTIFCRGIANSKYIPVIVGIQTKEEYLSPHLKFSYGDFYDTDGYFAKHLKPTDKVLLYGFHNLYYVNFPFIHETWIKKGDGFTHVATQGVALPHRFFDWDLIYENEQTSVRLYTKGKILWRY